MLNEILSELEKVREKDISTKRNIKEMIHSMKNDLYDMKSKIEIINNQMMVIIYKNRIQMFKVQ